MPPRFEKSKRVFCWLKQRRGAGPRRLRSPAACPCASVRAGGDTCFESCAHYDDDDDDGAGGRIWRGIETEARGCSGGWDEGGGGTAARNAFVSQMARGLAKVVEKIPSQ